jgi:hypothetical protein
MSTVIEFFPIAVVSAAAVIILGLIILFNDKQEPLQEII